MPRALLATTLLLALAACGDSNDTPLEPATSEGEALSIQGAQLTGTLVFAAPGAQSYDLFTVRPDGTGRTPLVSFPGNDVAPAWSSDNNQIAFIRSRLDGGNVLHGEVFVVDKTGGNGHWLTANPMGQVLRSPAWSPSGDRVLVVTPSSELISIDVATGVPTTLPYQADVATFDTTGDLILFSTPSSIRIGHADGSGVVRTIGGPGGRFVEFPRFSPDGQRIAFAAAPPASNNTDIYVVNADGTGMTRVAGTPAVETYPTWSPDGQTLVYTSSKRDVVDLWRVPVSGGHRTRVTTGGGQQPSWTH